jgi:hypothetical protein
LTDETSRRQAWSGLASQWITHDPEAAANFALDLFPEGEGRAAALKDIARQWGFFEDGAVQWSSRLPAGPDRDAFLSGVCVHSAVQDPEQAGRLAASMSPGQEQLEVVKQVVPMWCDFGEASAAATWAASLPGEAHAEAVREIAGNWAAKDPVASAAWLQSLPDDELRAQAAARFVENAAAKRPDLAAQWVGSVADETKRNKQIESIARYWLKLNPVAAEAWLEESRPRKRSSTPRLARLQLLDARDVQDGQFLHAPFRVPGVVARLAHEDAPAEHPREFRMRHIMM